MKLTTLQELENCALARMVDIYNGKVMTFYRTTQYKNIYKSLQALEIIKRDMREVAYVISNYNSFDEYNYDYEDNEYKVIKNQNEFDLLKEVML